MTTEKIPDAKPIASGQAFIGLCATRANALTLYTNRIFQILALNGVGLFGVISWIEKGPKWYMLVLYILALLIGLRRIYKLSQHIIKGSADNVKLWTDKLILLEKTSQVEGGINLFSSLDYEAHRIVPTLPVKEALWLVRAFVLCWIATGCASTLLLIFNTGG